MYFLFVVLDRSMIHYGCGIVSDVIILGSMFVWKIDRIWGCFNTLKQS